jgi:hypothetical protein
MFDTSPAGMISRGENPLPFDSDSDDFDEPEYAGYRHLQTAFHDIGDDSISSDSDSDGDEGTVDVAGWFGAPSDRSMPVAPPAIQDEDPDETVDSSIPSTVSTVEVASALKLPPPERNEAAPEPPPAAATDAVPALPSHELPREVDFDSDLAAPAEEIAVTFVEDGSLGLKFVGNPHANAVQIRAVNPGTQAESHAVLRPGLVLKSVGGTTVQGMSYQDTISVIKAQGRPVTCLFGPVQPLPEAMGVSPAAAAASVSPPDVTPEGAAAAAATTLTNALVAAASEHEATMAESALTLDKLHQASAEAATAETAFTDVATPTAVAVDTQGAKATSEQTNTAVPSDISRSEVLTMAQSVGFDEELLQDMIDGNDGDMLAVAAMLLEHGAVCSPQLIFK